MNSFNTIDFNQQKRMIKRIIPLILFAISNLLAYSQAGYGVYQFLDLPVSSRLSALGGSNISLHDNDINFAFGNPATMSAETNNVIGLSMANYLADIKFGSAVFGKTIGKQNYFGIGIQYVDYGSIKYATELNDQIGDVYFTAKDMALNVMYARPVTNKITVGGTFKPIYSAYEHYTSFGVALDAGVNYNDSANLFSAGMVIRNLGTQLKGFYSDEDGQHFEPLPLNIQLGVSKKLTHAPLRFSFTLNNLQHWDLNYESTNQTLTTLSTSSSSSSNTTTSNTSNIKFVDMFFRHTIVAVEFVPSKNFYLTAGYNHRRHQEMAVNGFKSMAGFSFGGGIKLYKFHVGFGTTQYLAGNQAYQFSISTALGEFRL
jgi:hypothetical protein